MNPDNKLQLCGIALDHDVGVFAQGVEGATVEAEFTFIPSAVLLGMKATKVHSGYPKQDVAFFKHGFGINNAFRWCQWRVENMSYDFHLLLSETGTSGRAGSIRPDALSGSAFD